jgi:nicotinamidase-related amidase
LDTVVLEDGCAAFSPAVHATAIDALRPVCRVASISEVMREIEGA